MNEAVRQWFKDACAKCLDAYALVSLRSYARSIGVDNPTKKLKGPLIAEIVSVLAREKAPVVRSTRGAPIKYDYVDPNISAAVSKLLYIFSTAKTVEECRMRENLPEGFEERFAIGVAEQTEDDDVRTGQLKIYDGVACLLPLTFDLSKSKVVVSVEQIRKYDLREGDLINYRAQVKNSVLYASEIVSINGFSVGTLSRVKFEEAAIALPSEKIVFTDVETQSTEGKMLDWLFPVGKGQRSLIVGEPKTGKTRFLLNAVKNLQANSPDLEVMVLLVDQAPEILCEYKNIVDKLRLIATTYTDEPSRHVLAAEFLQARAKRLAECGHDVVLIIDGMNALARAYDELDMGDSKQLPCGLSADTVRYIKKYFSSAKKLEKKGSLTVMATISCKTGVEADDVLATELSSVANHEIALDNALALRRIYPAVDFNRSHAEYESSLFTKQQLRGGFLYRNMIHPYAQPFFLVDTLDECVTYEDFYEKLESEAAKTDKK